MSTPVSLKTRPADLEIRVVQELVQGKELEAYLWNYFNHINDMVKIYGGPDVRLTFVEQHP